MKKYIFVLAVAVTLVPVSSSISADDDEILDFLPAILSGVKANPPTPPPTPPKPTPPPLPPGVTVLPTQSYLKDYSGDLQIVGEIYNNTTSSIKYVEINANVLTARPSSPPISHIPSEILSRQRQKHASKYTLIIRGPILELILNQSATGILLTGNRVCPCQT